MTATGLSATLTGGSLGDLALTAANGYVPVSFGLGGRVYRRDTAQSPYVAGRQYVGGVLDQVTRQLVVRVQASSGTTLDSLITSLLAHTDQASWTLQVTQGGHVQQWACEPADAVIGDDDATFNKYLAMAFRQVVTMTIPSQPYPVAGGF